VGGRKPPFGGLIIRFDTFQSLLHSDSIPCSLYCILPHDRKELIRKVDKHKIILYSVSNLNRRCRMTHEEECSECSLCTHIYVLPPPNGSESLGRCKLCGMEKTKKHISTLVMNGNTGNGTLGTMIAMRKK